MSERIKVSVNELWGSSYVQVGDVFMYISTSATMIKSAYRCIEEVLRHDNEQVLIINESIPPRWTIEDHLYNFLGEELYNEFWCEFDDSNNEFSEYDETHYIIADSFDWRKSAKGDIFWLEKSKDWIEYCKEMDLE